MLLLVPTGARGLFIGGMGVVSSGEMLRSFGTIS
jgi:hypothetical protein